MEGLQFKLLYLGHILCRKDCLIRTDDPGETVKSPMLSVLIRHPVLGNILYDTGNHELGDRIYSAHAKEIYPVPEVITVKDRLLENGLTVNRIDRIIISHLHMDHTGGLPYFSGTKAGKNGVIINEDDAREAFYQVHTKEDTGAYTKQTFCDLPGIEYTPVNGTVFLADDLILFSQRCHTPGVLGMILKTANHGNFIFTSDAVYMRESFEKELPPGGTINKTDEEFFNEVKLIKELQKQYDATLIFGHDPEQYHLYDQNFTD